MGKYEFSLSQKIFLVKSFYKNGEKMQVTLEQLRQKFNVQISSAPNILVVRGLILGFESSGKVTRQILYDLEPPKSHDIIQEHEETEGTTEETTEVTDQAGEVVHVQGSLGEFFESADFSHSEEVMVVDAEEGTSADPDPDEGEGDIEESEAVQELEEDELPPRVVKKKLNYRPLPRGPVETLFRCTTCPKSFGRKIHLQEHMSKHVAEERLAREMYICSICGQQLRDKRAYDGHMLIHSGTKAFKCSHCPKAFARKTGVQKHEMTHTGERPYVCRHCHNTFTTHLAHQLHERRHTGEKPYACKHCDERFIGQASLNNHLKTHGGEYVYQCGICNNRFKMEKTLQKHIEDKHNIQVSPEEIVYAVSQEDP